jgi:radical SAM-linked protein
MLARGGDELGPVILEAYGSGALFDAWSEHFNYDLWIRALGRHGLDIGNYIKKLDYNSPLAWDDIDLGIKREFLISQDRLVEQGLVTPDCRLGCTDHCGVCGGELKTRFSRQDMEPAPVTSDTESSHFGRRKKAPLYASRDLFMRIHYGRSPELKFLSHLDITKLIVRLLRIARIPLVYSRGFHPHPKVSFSQPLPMGCSSRAEYFDMELTEPLLRAVEQLITPVSPQGLSILGQKIISQKEKSLTASVHSILYEVSPLEPEKQTRRLIQDFLKEEKRIITRTTPKGQKKIDIRPLFQDYKFSGNCLRLFCRAGEGGTGRPQDFLKHVIRIDDEERHSMEIVRRSMFKWENGQLKDMME